MQADSLNSSLLKRVAARRVDWRVGSWEAFNYEVARESKRMHQSARDSDNDVSLAEERSFIVTRKSTLKRISIKVWKKTFPMSPPPSLELSL